MFILHDQPRLLLRALRALGVLVVVLPLSTSPGIVATGAKAVHVGHSLKVYLIDNIRRLTRLGLLLFGFGQNVTNLLHGRVVLEPAVFGELDVDDQVQVALVVGALDRHALATHLDHLLRAQDLAGGLHDVERDAAAVVAIVDRDKAIQFAIAKAQPGDLVLLAGKGHETGQERNGVKHPFDDVDEVVAAIVGTDR